jgi:hypothetical protein
MASTKPPDFGGFLHYLRNYFVFSNLPSWHDGRVLVAPYGQSSRGSVSPIESADMNLNERRQPIINTIVLMQASTMARREGSHILRCCEQAAWAAFQMKTRISLVNDPFSMSDLAISRQLRIERH